MSDPINRRRFLGRAATAALCAPLGVASTATSRAAELTAMLRFAIVSDGHFGQPETNYLRFHEEMIEWLNRENKARGLDFVILNGDLIHDEPRFLPKLQKVLEALEMPYYAVKGNHDMVTAATWNETWGYEENHSFSHQGCTFLLGTTSNEKGEYLCADLDWLRSELKAAAKKKAVFLFLHISQLGITRHGVDFPEVSGILHESENLAAVFHGHDHDQDNVIFSDKLRFFFDGHMGGSWGTNYRGYRIVEMDEQDQIRTYQCNPSAFYVNSSQI